MRATTVTETADLISGAPRVGFDSLALAGKGAASNEKSAESLTRTRQRPFRLRVWWAMRIDFSTAFRHPHGWRRRDLARPDARQAGANRT